jgi:RNA polymerase sigma-70 factor (ECF subfamily)
MYGFAFRILRSREEAEDAVQEVFIRLWKMGDKLDSYNSIDALATTMTKNYCIDLIRKQKRHPEEEYTNQESFHTSPSPHEELVSTESHEIIYNIIEELPEAYKIVIRLRETEGLSYEEIEAKTGQNINSLRVTFSRARKLIRDEYNKYQHERRGIKQLS